MAALRLHSGHKKPKSNFPKAGRPLLRWIDPSLWRLWVASDHFAAPNARNPHGETQGALEREVPTMLG